MGWTSFTYKEAKHLTFTAEKALDFCKREFNNSGYKILKFALDKAKDHHSNNVCYLVIKHPDDYNFLMVVLVSIVENVIYYKEMSSSMGPAEDSCPVEFLKLLPEATGQYDIHWRDRVRKNNITTLETAG